MSTVNSMNSMNSVNSVNSKTGRGVCEGVGGMTSNVQVRRRGFSLIEILVSILILALGLLGLGAVFPVVIREQRQATDNVAGTIAGNNVRATVRAAFQDQAVVRYREVSSTQYEVEYRGLAAILAGGYQPLRNPDNPDQAFAFNVLNYTGFSLGRYHSLWERDWQWQTGGLGSAIGGMDQTKKERGILAFPDGVITAANATLVPTKPWELPASFQAYATGVRNTGTSLPTGVTGLRRISAFEPVKLVERLNPGSVGLDETPTLVWDFIARRVPKGEFDAASGTTLPSIKDDLQLAVFVRRVDQGIRIPPGESLRTAIIGRQGGAPTVVPVGADQEDRATLDGTDGNGGLRYSWPLEAGARDGVFGDNDQGVFDFYNADAAGNRDLNEAELGSWLENVDVSTAQGEAMAQIGQKLIDNLGNVYTVDRVENDADGTVAGAKRIRLSPAPSLENVRLESVGTDGNRKRKIRQFVFTAQVPVSAFVVDVPVKREFVK